MKNPLSTSIGQWSIIGILIILIIIIGRVAVYDIGQHPKLSIISDTYATDGFGVYRNDKLIPGADANTFKVISNADSDYALDAHNVYYGGEVLSGANPATFGVLGGSSYFKDDHSVYYQGVAIPADSASFKPITTDCVCDLGVDKNTVYYGGVSIVGSDPATFGELSNGYFSDANAVYFNGQKVVGADVSSFVVLSDATSTSGITYDAKDKNHLYSEGDRVK